MAITDLKSYATDVGIVLPHHDEILTEAVTTVAAEYGGDQGKLKRNFDKVIQDTERQAYNLYLQYEREYGSKVLATLVNAIAAAGASSIVEIGRRLGEHHKTLDRFYLSLAQSRKARAGRVFETIHNQLFKALNYPFDEQPTINGKPDFVMPSVQHYRTNPLGCVIFTAKRTLRERWRQVVTEGTRGIGFYLATIDEGVSENALKEMIDHRIFLVVPKEIKNACYKNASNVLTFQSFFEDHLDPKKVVWDRESIT